MHINKQLDIYFRILVWFHRKIVAIICLFFWMLAKYVVIVKTTNSGFLVAYYNTVIFVKTKTKMTTF